MAAIEPTTEAEPGGTHRREPSSGRGVLTTLWSDGEAPPRVLLRDADSEAGGSALVRQSPDEMPDLGDRRGRLQLLGEIARGGMGAILKGRDADLGRDLAVKVLLEQHRERPELVRRFVEEAQIAGQLQHPGVVPVYELGTFADLRPYFAMKLVKGRTLSAMLARRTDPDRDRSRFLAIFLQVAQTVAYAHSRGVIHRDLKPSNVMVGNFGEVQVMDWGLAKVLPRGGASDDATAGRLDDHATVIATARSDGEAGSELSVAGSVMGTPSYMAPEQARGEVERLDERCDVFALGSILSEVLTGRPAFVGRNSGEIQRKAARGDVAEALAALGASGIDDDLASLAADCLAPEPEDRPSDAGAVADRLSGHLAGVEDRLRRAELAAAAESARAEEAKRTAEAAEARARAERRARRLTAALAASILGLAALGGGGGAWLRARQASRAASTTRAVNAALDRVAHLRGEAKAAPAGDLDRWREADAALKGADDLIRQGDADPPTARRVASARSQFDREFGEARSRATKVEADRKLLARLEEIRGDSDKFRSRARAGARYAEAFREAGLDLERVEPRAAGAWIAGRSAPIELVAYLDDWTNVRRILRTGPDDEFWRRLLATARSADPDPWRNALRDQFGLEDAARADAVRRLADDEPALARQPAASLLLLAAYLKGPVNDRERAGRVLRLAWRLNPGDYWTNTELAMFEAPGRPGKIGAELRDPAEAIRYLSVAVALHPANADARNLLGIALKAAGRIREAEAEYREAIRLAPKGFSAHINLGNTLMLQGRFDEAEAEFREAIRLAPRDSLAHINLGSLLARAGGQTEEAEAEYREAIRIAPGYPEAHYGLGNLLRNRKDRAGAEAELREAVRLGPDVANYRYHLGLLLLDLGKIAEAEAEVREAVRLAPDDGDHRTVHGNLLVSLRRPAEAEAEYREAIRRHPELAMPHHDLVNLLRSQGRNAEILDEIRAEVRRNPNDPLAHKNLGNLYFDLRNYEQAEAEYREALRIKPDFPNVHHNMGNILLARGSAPGALAAYRRAAEIYGPGSRQAENESPYIRKATLADRLPAVLRGEEKPDAAGLAEFAEVAQDSNLFAAAARLYGEAFAADPGLTAGDGPFNAACCAVLASMAQGRDAPPEADARVALRRKALDFLRNDIADYRSYVAKHPESAAGIAASLEGWKSDDDVAPVREAAELARLPEAERLEWQALWADHAALIEALRRPAPAAKP